MMKRQDVIRVGGLLLLGLVALLMATACATDAPGTGPVTEPATDQIIEAVAETAAPVQVSVDQTAPLNGDDVETAIGAAGAGPGQPVNRPAANRTSFGRESVQYVGGELSDDEITDLLFMREEEKLARDVYLTLYDRWGLPVFQNIAASEQTHTDAVKGLLDVYGLVDPVGDNGVGVFTDPDLQVLYDQLVADGGQSLAGALQVGAAIEEIDILDLAESLSRTDKPDITTVYGNLMAGSENHLRAFVSTLERQTGESYFPQYLGLDAYEAIMSGSAGQGRGNGDGTNGGGGNGGGRGNGRGRAG